MKNHRLLSPKWWILAPIAALLVVAVACGEDAPPAPAPALDVAAIQSAVQSAVASAVANIPAAEAPEIDAAAIQTAVTAAVEAAVPEGVSAAQIEALVKEAVSAAAQPGVTSEEIAAAVAAEVAKIPVAEAQEALSAAEIADIVEGALAARQEAPEVEVRVSYSAGEGEVPKKGLFVNAIALAEKHGDSPRYGGTFLNASVWLVDHHDPQQGAVNPPVLEPLYSNLVMTDPYEWPAIMPDLAYAWELSDDLKQLTFHLNEGVKWHDGVALTSADVEYTIERIWHNGLYAGNDTTGNFKNALYLLMMESDVETPDENTVVLNLKSYTPLILKLLVSNKASIVPKHISEKDVVNALKDDLEPVGSGPFKLTGRPTTTLWKYERNPDYFKSDTPFLDAIETHIIADTQAILTATMTGRIHWNSAHLSSKLGYEMAKDLASREPRIFWEGVPTFVYPFFVFNTKNPPLDDIRVRQAFSEVIQREMLTTEGLGERRGVVGTALFPTGEWAMPLAEREKLIGYGPDMDKRIAHAKELLADYEAEKGPINWDDLPFQCATNHVSCDLTVIIQHMMKEVDVNLKIEPGETGVVWFKQVDGDYFMSIMNGAMDVDDPTDTFAKNMITGAIYGFHKLSNPRIDELYEKQVFMTDKKQRREAVWEIDRLAMNDAGDLILYWAVNEFITWDFVKGYKRAPASEGQTDYRLEHVWLDLPEVTRTTR